MSIGNFEILLPNELIQSSDFVATTVQPIDSTVNQDVDSNGSGLETALVVTGILVLGAIAAFTNDRTAKDTAESRIA